MKKEKRFEVVEKESGGFLDPLGTAMIICDKKTGVMYLFCQSGYAGGITPLLDSDGKPVIDRFVR